MNKIMKNRMNCIYEKETKLKMVYIFFHENIHFFYLHDDDD